jgi:hypothetical protein
MFKQSHRKQMSLLLLLLTFVLLAACGENTGKAAVPNATSVNATPNPTPTPTRDFSHFVGTWYAHSKTMIINADGSAQYKGRVFIWCTDDPRPPCDVIDSSIITGGLNAQITFNSVKKNIASGSITEGTGDRDKQKNIIPVGSQITVTLNADDTLAVSDGSLLCGEQARQNNLDVGCNSGA